MTLTKAALIQQLVDRVGLNRRESADIVEAFFEQIAKALEAGLDVKLSGFGNFVLNDKAARPGRNPKTGVETTISARRVVTWHPSQRLKGHLDGAFQSEKVTGETAESRNNDQQAKAYQEAKQWRDALKAGRPRT